MQELVDRVKSLAKSIRNNQIIIYAVFFIASVALVNYVLLFRQTSSTGKIDCSHGAAEVCLMIEEVFITFMVELETTLGN